MRVQLLILSALLCAAQSAKILGIFPVPGPSHYFLGSALMRGLAEKGHDVTVISPFGEKTAPKGGSYRDVVLTGMYEEMQEKMKEINFFEKENDSPFLNSLFIVTLMPKMSEDLFNHPNVQKLIHSNETFDAVIVEQFMNDAQRAFATHFKAPLISLSTVGANFWTNGLVGNPAPPSYVGEMALNLPAKLNFWNRLYNSVFRVFMEGLYHLYVYPQQDKVIKKYIPNGPNIEDVLYNSSIMLMNSHISINTPVPYVPNMIDIGGYHVKPPKKLPKDLQEYLDNAKEGVVYFSMGSNLKSAMLPEAKRNAIIKAFARLKLKVLWKWEDDSLPNQPANVKLSKWLPQNDLLAHPNIKLFISHGGYLSTTETIYHGVPVLAIPIFGDQKSNAQIAVNKGYGLTLPFPELTEDALYEKITELLTNPKYKNNAKHISKLFHDRPIKPMDLAVYWVEYVIRHGGAPHLRVGALDLPWYQYHLLDVIAFVGVVGLVGLGVIVYLLKKICRRSKCKKGKKEKLKKQ